MGPQIGIHLELLWYWEGRASQYYKACDHWRSSRELSCWYLRKGSADLRWPDGRRKVNAGHLIIPPPLRRNEFFSADAEVHSMRLNAYDADGRMLLCPSVPFVHPLRENASMEVRLQELRTILRDDLKMDVSIKTPLTEIDIPLRTSLKLRGCMSHWMETVLDTVEETGGIPFADADHHPAVTAALNYLSNRSLDEPFKEGVLVEKSGVSLPHLRRLFRTQIGLTLKQWDGKRLEASIKKALKSGKFTCKEVAHAHGFNSGSHFSRWFLQTQQCTPNDWRTRKESDDIV
jgi:AraC-like DNA-binding protein